MKVEIEDADYNINQKIHEIYELEQSEIETIVSN